MNFKIEIIDNFFNLEDFKKLNTLHLEDVQENSLKIFHNKINNNNVIMESCIDNDLLLKLYKTYNSRVLSILKSLNLSKSEIVDYTDITIIKTGKNYKFPIHDDTPDKLLSGVIYLKVVPALGKNEGAIEFSMNGQNYHHKNSPSLIFQPEVGDIVFFPSSLHHRTIPFTTDTDRIIISFDLMPEAAKR